MADMSGGQTIIIKKVKKGGHGHHGGAWKVAYADFVTAMMAFFLLLWLLNSTTQEQKKGIADYFAPASVARSNSGSGGVLGGQVLAEGSRSGAGQPVTVNISLPSPQGGEADSGEDAEDKGSDDDATKEDDAAKNEEALRKEIEERENAQFEAAEKALRQAIDSVPDLKSMAKNLIVDQTPEGLRIQIVDQEGRSMFPSGRAQMYDHTKKLISLVVGAIAQLPNKISIKGHTDATPFSGKNGYSNWELSTDRAHASRRALVDSGLALDRIASVSGRAAQEPFVPDDPFSPRNRRISIILLREAGNKVQAQSAPQIPSEEDKSSAWK